MKHFQYIPPTTQTRDGQVPTEQFSFNFEEIKVTYDDGHKDWINLLSVSQSVSRP